MTASEVARVMAQACRDFAPAGACGACIATAVRLAVEEEREACARIVEEMYGRTACEIWQAIRARGAT